MKGPGCQFANGWIYFIAVALVRFGVLGERQMCPEDINGRVVVCLQPYHSQMDTIDAKQLFMGLDAEVIRATCTALWSSIKCARELYDICPESQHPDIVESLAPSYSMYGLCSYPGLFETYARYMTCYRRLGAYSEKCFEKFRAQIEPEAIEREDPVAVRTMCSEYSTLVTCVKTNVEIQCNSTQGAQLTDILIRPAVKKSSLCIEDSTENSKQPKTERRTTEATKSFKWQDTNASSCLCRTWTMAVLSVFLCPVLSRLWAV